MVHYRRNRNRKEDENEWAAAEEMKSAVFRKSLVVGEYQEIDVQLAQRNVEGMWKSVMKKQLEIAFPGLLYDHRCVVVQLSPPYRECGTAKLTVRAEE